MTANEYKSLGVAERRVFFIAALVPVDIRKEADEDGTTRYAGFADLLEGKATLKELARIAVERGCGRLEWWCLDWNRPSIDFYLSLGAVPMDEWTTYRVTGDTLKKLAQD